MNTGNTEYKVANKIARVLRGNLATFLGGVVVVVNLINPAHVPRSLVGHAVSRRAIDEEELRRLAEVVTSGTAIEINDCRSPRKVVVKIVICAEWIFNNQSEPALLEDSAQLDEHDVKLVTFIGSLDNVVDARCARHGAVIVSRAAKEVDVIF